jgi:hypothetical protein
MLTPALLIASRGGPMAVDRLGDRRSQRVGVAHVHLGGVHRLVDVAPSRLDLG